MADAIDAADAAPQPSRPIFILGILPRCGTNFLMDLLCAHRDCAAPQPLWEDFFVHHIDQLDRYVESVARHWTPDWGVERAHLDRLRLQLGRGLVALLSELAGTNRVVTKTPRTENLDRFFDYFPDADLLIVVRDGRAVVESGIRSFAWNRESAIHKWAQSAERILAFDRPGQSPDRRYRLVRYEDLWSDLESQLRAIFGFLGLDAAGYDFAAAANIPVRGSSESRAQSDRVHWAPTVRDERFDPMSRFAHWGTAKHARFNRVAGRQLEQLGYQPALVQGPKLVWEVWNLMLDLWWLVLRAVEPLYRWLARRRKTSAS